MKYYTGLDVSMKTTSICIINQDGKIVFEKEVETDPQDISNAIIKSKFQVENIAVESGSITSWLVRELKLYGLPIICIDSRKMSKVLSININKTDKNDARLIAEALRCNFYSEVHQKSEGQTNLGIALGARRTLINLKTTIRNTIRGHLKAFGIRLGAFGNDIKFIEKVEDCVKGKSEIVSTAISALLISLDSLSTQIVALDKEIEKLAKEHEDIKLLKTVPGVGNITALTYLTYLGDPTRFKSSRAVGAYFGLTPRQYSSGETVHQGRISKCGNTEVRSMLAEAATSALCRTKSFSRVKAWGFRIKKKKGHKKAAIAVARKYSIIMHRMLVTRKPFEYGEPREKKEKLSKVA